MDEFESQDGVAFLLILFVNRQEYRYLPFRDLKVFWDRAEAGGRKSFRVSELDDSYIIPENTDGVLIPYLEMLQKDINGRGEI